MLATLHHLSLRPAWLTGPSLVFVGTGVAGEMWTELAKHEVEHTKAHAHTGPLANVRERGKEFRQQRDRDVDRYYTANRIYDRFFESDIGCPFLEVTRAGALKPVLDHSMRWPYHSPPSVRVP